MRFRKTLHQIANTIDGVTISILRLFKEEIVVIGDSHAEVFRSRLFRKQFPRKVFNVVAVTGATVSGLENPNSKTQAMPIFMDRIKRSKAKTTIVLLGEVDTGFVIWYRAEKHKAAIATMLDKALTNYQNLLSAIGESSRVICISAPLPTIRDGQDWGAVANARKDVKATQRERTRLTKEFNRQMGQFCSEQGYIHLSFDDESSGADGLVIESLLNPDASDHHYDTNQYAMMIASQLGAIIDSEMTTDRVGPANTPRP